MTEQKNDKKNERKTTDEGTPVVETMGRDFRVEGNDVTGYVGVDAEYRTYANETERPYLTDEDVALLEKSGQPTDVEVMTQQNKALDAQVAGQNPVGDSQSEETGASTSSSPEAEAASGKNSNTESKGAADASKQPAKTAETVAATKASAAKSNS